MIDDGEILQIAIRDLYDDLVIGVNDFWVPIGFFYVKKDDPLGAAILNIFTDDGVHLADDNIIVYAYRSIGIGMCFFNTGFEQYNSFSRFKYKDIESLENKWFLSIDDLEGC